MDTTFPGNALMYRSITNPTLWQIAYAMIIAAEGVTGILFLAGAIRLFQVRDAPARSLQSGQGSMRSRPAMLGFLVWFFGFMVVAGEWFAMWQSATWNGQEAAFRFYVRGARRADLREPARRGTAQLCARRPGRHRAAAVPANPKRKRRDAPRKRAGLLIASLLKRALRTIFRPMQRLSRQIWIEAGALTRAAGALRALQKLVLRRP